MRAFFRFVFVIPTGFIAACLTAAFAMLWPFLDISPRLLLGDPVLILHTAIAFFAQAAQIGAAMILPFALFALVSEMARLDGILAHLAGGFVGAVGTMLTVYGADRPAPSVQTAILVAGVVFALVYWTIAGRRAGHWRRRAPKAVARDAPAPDPAHEDRTA